MSSSSKRSNWFNGNSSSTSRAHRSHLARYITSSSETYCAMTGSDEGGATCNPVPRPPRPRPPRRRRRLLELGLGISGSGEGCCMTSNPVLPFRPRRRARLQVTFQIIPSAFSSAMGAQVMARVLKMHAMFVTPTPRTQSHGGLLRTRQRSLPRGANGSIPILNPALHHPMLNNLATASRRCGH